MLAFNHEISHKRQSRKNVGFFTASNQNEGLTRMTDFPYTSIIWLTQDKYAIVDNDDYEWLSQFKWCAAKYGKRGHLYYAKRLSNTKMHCWLIPTTQCVDHINGNGLDNRKINLRICSKGENIRNTNPRNKLGLKGVNIGRGGLFEATLQVGGRLHLGSFHNKELAAKIRDIHTIKIDPIYSRLNYILSPEEQSELWEFYEYYLTNIRRKPRNWRKLTQQGVY